MKQSSFLFFKTWILASALSSSLAFAGETAAPAKSAVSVSAPCVIMSPVEQTKIMVAKILNTLTTDQGALNTDFAKVEKDISEIVSPTIDIEKIANYVVPAALMSSATPEEKAEFNKVLLAFFINSYSTAFKSFNPGPNGTTIAVQNLRAGMEQKSTVQVNTVISTDQSGNPSSKIPVALVMVRDEALCAWKYVDFCVDNVCAVSNVQSQIFAIKAKSLEELKKYIDDHNKKVLQGM